eukprot:snap_masked-scaffold_3-processed-gene-15.48-mRNA-1 protein AED:0.41 eAED:0.57 QI:0/-1/0/1/-1/1/1/0/118
MGDRSNLDDIMHEIMMNEPGARGSPPVSESCLKNLIENKKVLKVDAECAICKEEKKKGDSVVEIECGHTYCEECIVPWLKKNNSCPVCRHELPTNDKEYERKKVHEERIREQRVEDFD